MYVEREKKKYTFLVRLFGTVRITELAFVWFDLSFLFFCNLTHHTKNSVSVWDICDILDVKNRAEQELRHIFHFGTM